MLRIGRLQLRTNLLLAPIAGYCDLAFRMVCREAGALGGAGGGLGLACTDLLSPQGLLRGSAASLDLAATNAADKPIGMQLYGSDPDIMAEGARWAVEHGATVVDINMGCPVDKVTKKDGGSKLLTDPSRAAAIAGRVARELERCPLSAEEWAGRLGDATLVGGPGPVPLTCKIRLCWSTAEFEAGRACSPELARTLAGEGAAAVTVHGRTTEMKFAGAVRLDGIARVVDAVAGRIPIIGNGDVRTPADAERMIRLTGCDGVMIGRGALAAPWIFRDAWHHLHRAAAERRGAARPDPCPAALPSPTEGEKVAIIRRYFDLMREHRGDHYAMHHIRRRISWFAKSLVGRDEAGAALGCRPLKEAVRLAESPAAVYDALACFQAGGLRSAGEEAPADAGMAPIGT